MGFKPTTPNLAKPLGTAATASPATLDAPLREHVGFEGLAAELGQCDPNARLYEPRPDESTPAQVARAVLADRPAAHNVVHPGASRRGFIRDS